MTKKTQRALGFAAMDPQRQREIAQQGGLAAHQKGRAYTFTPEKAREAGKKGAAVRAANLLQRIKNLEMK